MPQLLRDLYGLRRTGLLHFDHDAGHGSICFVNGHITWGQSSMPECHLGPVLVRHGLLSQEALDQVYDLVGGGKRLGDVLLELGSLDRETLDEALALQVRETLLAVLAWHDGGWRFEEYPLEHFRGYDRALRISTANLILDAVWSVSDSDVVRYALGDLNRTLALTTDPLLRFQRVTLTDMDGLLLSQIDGVRSAAEVLAQPGAGSEDLARRCLFGLLCTGIVDYVAGASSEREQPEPAPSREEVLSLSAQLVRRDHFQVLGLSRASSEADAGPAFARLARRFHPDARHHPTLADLGPELDAIFLRLVEARRVLTDPQRRAEYEGALLVAELNPAASPGDGPTPAAPVDPLALHASHEELVTQAEREFELGRYFDALQVVEGMLGEWSGRLRLRALLLRARIYLKNPKWQREAEEQLKALVREDPANAEAFFVLGQFYQAAGVTARAAAMFRRALNLKPRHAGALSELQAGSKSPAQ